MFDDPRGTQDLGDLRIQGFEKPSICRFKIPKIECLKIVGLGDLEISEFQEFENPKIQRPKTGGSVRSSGLWIRGFDLILESERLPRSRMPYPSIQGSDDPRKRRCRAKQEKKVST